MIFTLETAGRTILVDDVAATVTEGGVSCGTFIRRNALGSYAIHIDGVGIVNGIQLELHFNNGSPETDSDLWYEYMPSETGVIEHKIAGVLKARI